MLFFIILDVSEFCVRALEGITPRDVTSLQTQLEPLHALFRRTMVEGLRNSIATSFGLQIVVTYLLGTIDSLLNVTVLQ